MKQKSGFLEKINKINKVIETLLSQSNRNKNQINNITDGKGSFKTDTNKM